MEGVVELLQWGRSLELENSMAIGYRSIFRISAENDPLNFIERHISSWLEEKCANPRSKIRTTDWDGPGVYELGEGVELRVVHKNLDSPAREYRLYRLAEHGPGGRFVVSIYVISHGNNADPSPNVAIEVEHPSDNQFTAILKTGTPRIVGRILDSSQIVDGHAQITGSPIRITRQNSSMLIDAIADRHRTVSVIAGGSPSYEADDEWESIVQKLTSQSVGLAAIYSVDADALEEIDAELGSSHEVRPGYFRTYAPQVDLKNADDSPRHKWLAPTTLMRSITDHKSIKQDLQFSHASSVRRRLIEQELPSSISVAIALLRRQERAMLREDIATRDVAIAVANTAMVPVMPVSERTAVETSHVETTGDPESQTSQTFVKPSLPQKILGHLKKILTRWLPDTSAKEITSESLADLENFIVSVNSQLKTSNSQLSELETAYEQLEKEVAVSKKEEERLELELTIHQDEAVHHERVINDLWRQISRANVAVKDVAVTDNEWKTPVSMLELVQLLTPKGKTHKAITLVEFTGRPEGAQQIDERYQAGRYNTQIWQYVRALYSYAEQKKRGLKASFHTYLSDPNIDGEKVPTTHYSAGESQSVGNRTKWRAMRMLPVPKAVDASESIYMEAHFTPSRSDTFAPRVHFYDDTSGPTGKVYIGYIGRHLENTQTTNT